MWTAITRTQHRRDGLRFPSDLTDAEWAVPAPLLPKPSRIGRNRRLAKNFEATVVSATAFLYAASVLLLVRRMARCA